MKVAKIKKLGLLIGKIGVGLAVVASVIFLAWKAFNPSSLFPDCTVLLKQTRAGYSLLIDQRDKYDGLDILLSGQMPGHIEAAITQILEPGDIAIDVGAGFGYY